MAIQKFCKVKSSLVTTAALLCILYLAPLSIGLKITKHKAAFNNLSLNGNSEGVKCIVDFKSPRRYDEPSRAFPATTRGAEIGFRLERKGVSRFAGSL